MAGVSVEVKLRAELRKRTRDDWDVKKRGFLVMAKLTGGQCTITLADKSRRSKPTSVRAAVVSRDRHTNFHDSYCVASSCRLSLSLSRSGVLKYSRVAHLFRDTRDAILSRRRRLLLLLFARAETRGSAIKH